MLQPEPGPKLGHPKRKLVLAVLQIEPGTDLGHFKSHAVLLPQFLQLRKDAVSQTGGALCVQAVHHALHQVDLRGRGSCEVPAQSC